MLPPDGAVPHDLSLEIGERRRLLWHLSQVQRSIIAQRALPEILDQIVLAARELVGADVVVLHMPEGVGSPRTKAVASAGASQSLLVDLRGIGGARPGEWLDQGMNCGIATPIPGAGPKGGHLEVAFRDGTRRLEAGEQVALVALAEEVRIATNHAQAVDEAAHDVLTGLPGRSLLLRRVERALAAVPDSPSTVGVMAIDLEDFKTFNDSLGHAAGDEILVEAARRLEGALGPDDILTRPGSDEFAILLGQVEAGRAGILAARILSALAMPIAISGHEVRLGASIGLGVGSTDARALMRDADIALHQAKAQGNGAFRIFEPRMHDEVVERLELDVGLTRAIAGAELELVYQPIFAMRSGRIQGLEALVRWRHPIRGLLPPDQFIPLAEASGRIHELGRWVLRAASHQAALWRAKYPSAGGVQVGVNISAAQLGDDTLVAYVSEALAAARLEPEGLTLEITESALMGDFEVAARRLNELKDLGVEIAVDDFGIGHSSLRYLKELPLDNVKIAKPFVDEIVDFGPEPPILRAILDLARAFGLRAVAEGIERPEQAAALLDFGCELGQGHALSEPISAAGADDLILRVGLLGGPTPPEAFRDGGHGSDGTRTRGLRRDRPAL